jgi:hypothetical protein
MFFRDRHSVRIEVCDAFEGELARDRGAQLARDSTASAGASRPERPEPAASVAARSKQLGRCAESRGNRDRPASKAKFA